MTDFNLKYPEYKDFSGYYFDEGMYLKANETREWCYDITEAEFDLAYNQFVNEKFLRDALNA